MTKKQLYQQALDAYDRGDYSQAEACYMALLQEKEQEPPATLLSGLGLVRYALGNYAGAAAAFTQAIQAEEREEGQSADTWFNLGLSYKQLGLFSEAEQAYEQALSMAPQEVDYRYNLACCVMDGGDEQRAIGLFEDVLNIQNDYLPAINNLAYVYHRLGKYHEAEKLYSALLRHEPDHLAATFMLASLQGQAVHQPPADYVRDLFDNYAQSFEHELLGNLEYQAPQLLWQAHEQVRGAELMHTKDGACLDLGCGTGLAGWFFQQGYTFLAGIDLSANMVANAAEKEHPETGKPLYDRLDIGDILQILGDEPTWLQEQDFSCFLAADVLTYLGELDQLFTLVSTHLCPQGLFCFSVETGAEGNVAPDGWTLQSSGRYAHGQEYIRRLVETNGMTLVYSQPAHLRKERGNWVAGQISIAKKDEQASI